MENEFKVGDIVCVNNELDNDPCKIIGISDETDEDFPYFLKSMEGEVTFWESGANLTLLEKNPITSTLTHNLNIKGYTHSLTHRELKEIKNLLEGIL